MPDGSGEWFVRRSGCIIDGVLFEQGKIATVTGDAVDLSGTYTITVTSDGSVELDGEGDRNLRVSPRHQWLRDSGGKDVDHWSICNVYVDDELAWIARVTESADGKLELELSC